MGRSERLSVSLPVSSILGLTCRGVVGRRKLAPVLGLSDLLTSTYRFPHVYMCAYTHAGVHAPRIHIYVRHGREVGQMQRRRGFQPSDLFKVCLTTTDGE